jgi:hypothetical protein
MQSDAIDYAVAEAERFLRKAQLVIRKPREKNYRPDPEGPKETGALRRASMDLTRALAEMRKP